MGPEQGEDVSETPFKVVDPERIAQLVVELGDDEELVRDTLRIFAQQLPERVSDIDAMDLAEVDEATWRRTVHALGSPAAMLGLAPLTERCRAAERSPRADWPQARTDVLELAEHCRIELAEFLGSSG